MTLTSSRTMLVSQRKQLSISLVCPLIDLLMHRLLPPQAPLSKSLHLLVLLFNKHRVLSRLLAPHRPSKTAISSSKASTKAIGGGGTSPSTSTMASLQLVRLSTSSSLSPTLLTLRSLSAATSRRELLVTTSTTSHTPLVSLMSLPLPVRLLQERPGRLKLLT